MVLFYPPLPELHHLINRIILIRYHLDPTAPRITNPFPPQPENCLFFYPYDRIMCRNYGNDTLREMPHSILVGPQLARVDLTMGYNMLVIAVFFKPGGMHRLLGIPMTEMADRAFDSDLILGNEINEITERLNETVRFDKMIEIVQLYLLKKAQKLKYSLPIDKVLAEKIPISNETAVDFLARQACVSTRQLERQFKERIGMSPKLFLRMVRFSKAWVMREKNPEISWLKIAHACRYSDQMHMIRDFKDFVGVTPGILQSDLEKSSLRLQGTTVH